MNHNGDTAKTAYLINNVENFKLLRDRVNDGTEERSKYYVLTRDLDLTNEHDCGLIGYVIGSLGELGGSYTGPFNGHFDGNGHIILLTSIGRLVIQEPVNIYAGLFGVIDRLRHRYLNQESKYILKYNRKSYNYTRWLCICRRYCLRRKYSSNRKLYIRGIVNSVHEDTGYAGAGGIIEDGADVKDCEVKVGSSISAIAAGNRNGDSWAGV